MRASVVIATSNRGPSLRSLLEALRHQTFGGFEVVVVKGPSTDDTDAVLADWASAVRVVENPERNLSQSRNLGIDLAAGEIVAFIDDDSVPEPRWLQQLMEPYEDEGVGGVGGLVYDVTGVNMQFRYAVCDRIGRTDFDRRPPFDEFSRPGADPFVYLQGTNMSFRRSALEAVGGFDENIEYVWDDVDIAMQLIDAGWQILPLDGAGVHHKVLPSALRRGKGELIDPFTPVKNRTYFALLNGIGRHPSEDIVRSLTDQLDQMSAHANIAERHGRFSAKERAKFSARLQAGFDAGFEQGVHGERAGRALAAAEPGAFRPYPVIDAGPKRLSICFVSLDYPPRPMGGIARYTVDLARGIAAHGHEVHVVTQSEPPYRLDFEDGVWVHRYPEGARLVPSLGTHPLTSNLTHVAKTWRVVDDVARRFPLDLVTGNVWLAEVVGCALDPRWPTVMTLSTPVRTIASTQPAVASRPEVQWQIKLEDAALERSDQLHPLSTANLEHVREYAPAASDIPAEVVWLGMDDRAGDNGEPPPHDGVEILFVGRLEPRKGIDTLLRAATKLLAERPDVRLRIAGADNPYASDDPRPYAERVAESLAGQPDVRSRIIFEGEVSETVLDRLFSQCDIFCAPSRYESFGLMNLEAMMFSRPVVSCRVGGIEEVVISGETGILVDQDDSETLCGALRTLVDDPALRQRMGAAGRKRYETEFTNELAVRRIVDLFRRTISRAPGQPASEADAESAVRAGLAELIGELGGIERPADAAAELLDPAAFPYDYLAVIERLQGASDHEFVAGLYEAILQREPDLEGIESRVPGLIGGTLSRSDVVREIATSEEARWRGVDSRFLERLDRAAPAEMIRRMRDAFWRDDAQFATALGELLVPPRVPHDAEINALLDAARTGSDRHAVLSDLVGLKEVRDRVPESSVLLDEEFFTPDELRDRLASLAASDDSGFVDGIYRILVGRAAEPGAVAGNTARLREISRRQLIAEVAGSLEAGRRGVDPAIVDAAAADVPELQTAPARAASMLERLERVPGGGTARHAGKRLLRDPNVRVISRQVAELRDALSGYSQFSQMAARESAMQVDRLNAEVRGLSEAIEELRASITTDAPGGLRAELGGLREGVSSEIAAKSGSHGTYLGNGRIMVGLTWGGSLLVPADDMSLTPELVTRGIYEPAFTRYLMRTLKPGHRVIDVGANFGMHTILMAGWVGTEGHVMAYEPNPDVLSFLQANVALNWVSDRVTIRDAGIAGTPGRRTLFITERFMGNSSLLKPDEQYFANVPMDTVREVEIEVVTLDQEAESFGHVDLVKIDVEGTECSVMKGMTGLIDAGQIDRVCFEVYRDRMGDNWREFSELLREYARAGWRFHDIAADGSLTDLELEELLEVGRYSQVALCRADVDD